MVTLEVERNNRGAYIFYQSLGFKKIGEKVFEIEGISMNCDVLEKHLDNNKPLI